MAQGRVIDRDLGWSDFLSLIADADDKVVVVGILDGEIADYAAVNEYGSPSNNIPSRPFMRTTIDDNAQELAKMLRDRVNAAIARRNTTATGALKAVGLHARNLMVKSIRNWTDPPNEASTIERKGDNNPLVDTGAMQASITFEVRRKGF
jgi:hypothetical protein